MILAGSAAVADALAGHALLAHRREPCGADRLGAGGSRRCGAGSYCLNSHDFSDLGIRRARPVVTAERGPARS
jgi:hypothetical protein